VIRTRPTDNLEQPPKKGNSAAGVVARNANIQIWFEADPETNSCPSISQTLPPAEAMPLTALVRTGTAKTDAWLVNYQLDDEGIPYLDIVNYGNRKLRYSHATSLDVTQLLSPIYFGPYV
jgi:hypothetical protein